MLSGWWCYCSNKTKKDKTMQNKKSLKLKVWIAALLICSCFCLTKVNAQCSYGAIMVVCHSNPGSSGGTCCGYVPQNCYPLGKHDVILPLPGNTGTVTTNPSIGLAPTCGGGNSATGVGDAFTGTCAWNESGSNCGTPWGPTPETGNYTAYPCTGYCPPPG